ncbi:MAG: condensation domain-containing protein [Acidobacteriota bacterium]
MQRKLGAFESALTLSDAYAPLNVVAVLRLARAPSAEVLRRALKALQLRHPLLRRCIVDDGRRGPCFARCGGREIPLQPVPREDDEAWIRAAEVELGRRIDVESGPLLRCARLASPSGGEILLTLHHAIMDAASAVNLCQELLTVCAVLENGGEAATGDELTRSLPALPAAEALFPPAYQGWRRRAALARFILRQIRSEAVDRWRASGCWHAPAAGPDRCRILTFRLSEAETTALVRRSRQRRVTLNSVFDAAQLLAVARHRYRGQSLPLRHLIFANLRPYLEPPIAAKNLGAYFAMLRLSSRVHPGLELWELATEIQAEFLAAARRGEKFAASLTSRAMMRGLLRLGSERMAATALSYVGAVRLDTPGAFEVRGLHAFVANFGLGPEYTAQVRLYEGRIGWDILYLDADLSPQAAQRVADEIRRLLTEAE